MRILQKKEKNREDSFWYRGEIAEQGKYVLLATGDIDVIFPDGVREKDDRAVYEATIRKWHDKDLQKLEWNNNNWFEVVYCWKDKNKQYHIEDCELGEVVFSYDEGIELLKIYAKKKFYKRR